MTIIEIWNAKRELYRVQKITERPQQLEPIQSLAKRIEAPIPPTMHDKQTEFINLIIHNIHIVLQTEMMLQACMFAAASAIVSCISVILFLFFR
jgi:hypothetical protein